MSFISWKIWIHKANLDQEKNLQYTTTINKMHEEDREDRRAMRESYDNVGVALNQLSEHIRIKN